MINIFGGHGNNYNSEEKDSDRVSTIIYTLSSRQICQYDRYNPSLATQYISIFHFFSMNDKIDPELYRRLKAEAASPFRSLRRFFYIGFGASGFIGGVVFLAKLAAGRDLEHTIPNLALQIGVVALMVFLYRQDRSKSSQ
jgi:Low psii accumulation1 / Rep27